MLQMMKRMLWGSTICALSFACGSTAQAALIAVPVNGNIEVAGTSYNVTFVQDDDGLTSLNQVLREGFATTFQTKEDAFAAALATTNLLLEPFNTGIDIAPAALSQGLIGTENTLYYVPYSSTLYRAPSHANANYSFFTVGAVGPGPNPSRRNLGSDRAYFPFCNVYRGYI